MINKLLTFQGLFARKKKKYNLQLGYWTSDIEIKGSLHVIITVCRSDFAKKTYSKLQIGLIYPIWVESIWDGKIDQ